jgi:toxin FitB
VIILDTNVISELTKLDPDPVVLAWSDRQALSLLHATAVTEAEMLFGIRALPAGRRRDDFERAVLTFFSVVLASRVLPFDRVSADHFANLAAARRQQGRRVGTADLQIAAMALANNASLLVTRNIDDFKDCGVPLLNPWVPI